MAAAPGVGTVDALYLFNKNGTLVWSYNISLEKYSDFTSVAISSDGSYIVAGTTGHLGSEGPTPQERRAYLFSHDDNNPLWTYQTEGNSGVTSVAISSDGSYIVVAGGGGSVDGGIMSDRVWVFSGVDNTPLWENVTGSTVYALDISSSGNYIVVGTVGEVWLFSRSSSIPIWAYEVDSIID